MDHVVKFGATASQVLLDLIFLGQALGRRVPETFCKLYNELPDDYRQGASDLSEVFGQIAVMVENGEDLKKSLGWLGDATKPEELVEQVMKAVIRRAAVNAQQIVTLFESGDSPTLVFKTPTWGRFVKDIIIVTELLKCLSHIKRVDGKIVRDEAGKPVRVRGVWLHAGIFTGRYPNAQALSYLEAMTKIDEMAMHSEQVLTQLVTAVKAISGGTKA